MSNKVLVRVIHCHSGTLVLQDIIHKGVTKMGWRAVVHTLAPPPAWLGNLGPLPGPLTRGNHPSWSPGRLVVGSGGHDEALIRPIRPGANPFVYSFPHSLTGNRSRRPIQTPVPLTHPTRQSPGDSTTFGHALSNTLTTTVSLLTVPNQHKRLSPLHRLRC